MAKIFFVMDGEWFSFPEWDKISDKIKQAGFKLVFRCLSIWQATSPITCIKRLDASIYRPKIMD